MYDKLIGINDPEIRREFFNKSGNKGIDENGERL